MNVHLTPELEVLVQRWVESGRYRSTDEVMHEALQLMEQRDDLFDLRKEEIRRKIDEGLTSLSRGEGIDGEQAFRRLDERHEMYRQDRSI